MLKDLLNLLFPNTCSICQEILVQEEKHLCSTCLFAFQHCPSQFPLSENLKALLQVEHIYGHYYFSKNSKVQKLLHNIKYKGMQKLALELGFRMGQKIPKIMHVESLDYLVPIPLHKKRQRMRGYNQSFLLAQGISNSTGIPISHQNLIRIKHTKTQTKQKAENRHRNIQGAFRLKHPTQLNQKRILLVDDVLTTGATVEAACDALAQAKNCQINLAFLAVAKQD